MKVNVEATRKYYQSGKSRVCDCGECKSYLGEIKGAYPSIVKYLGTLGVDVAQPLELCTTGEDMGTFIEFISCEYVVLGSCEDDFRKTIDGVAFSVSESHPETGVEETHFVIRFSPIYIPVV